MLTYSFSRREKFLLLIMAIILVAVAWFVLVYQRTTNEITSLESQIATTQSQVTIANSQVAKMNQMQAVIDKYKEAGVAARPMPDFDNMTAVMTELNAVLAGTDTYSLAFDELDTTSSPDYVLRGVRANYSCSSLDAAEAVIDALANGSYPCSIDTVTITDGSAGTGRTSSSAAVSASIHITYFERK